MVEQLLPVLILFVVVIAFGATMIGVANLLGTRTKYNAVKAMPYECGVIGQDPKKTQIPVKFYLTAISFILFDIEIVFLYPFAITFVPQIKALGGLMLISTGVFVGVLVFGLFYEWKTGALNWD